jgi:ABC-type transporter Mla MlaB component
MASLANHTTIALDGNVGLRNAKDIQQRLLRAFKQFNAITIDVRSVEHADTSFLQLLIAARKKATAQGHQLTLKADPWGALETLLRSAGVLGASGECRHPEDQFWLGAMAREDGVTK